MFPLFRKLDVESFHCDVCNLAKHKRSTFPTNNNKRSSEPFHLIHSDIWGPSHVPNISDTCWFVSCINDCTRVSYIFLLKHKFNVSFVLPNFHNMIKNQFGVTIKGFWSDNARDDFNQVLAPYFQHEGIIHELSCVNTSQQNGIVERKNDHLLDTTRTFLFQKHVPKSYWGEVVLTITHLTNQLPSRVPWIYFHRFILIWEP